MNPERGAFRRQHHARLIKSIFAGLVLASGKVLIKPRSVTAKRFIPTPNWSLAISITTAFVWHISGACPFY